MRVLIVEDEHRIATAIKKGLEQEGYVVDMAFDGEEGLYLAEAESHDIIILDLMLPKVDGFELCKRLRSRNIHTPILILSAKGMVNDKVKGLDLGADDYLTKPFAFEELLARVRAISKRSRELLSDLIVNGDVKINIDAKEVYKNDVLVSLSSKEYSVIEYLMRNIGKTISKEQMISHVWSYDSDVMENTVEVTIKNLRKKLGVDLIKTIRGFGYKIEKASV